MRREMFIVMLSGIALLMSVFSDAGYAASYSAGPDDYTRILRNLMPGDVLNLRPGNYRRGLRIHDMQGLPGQPITIAGSPQGRGTVFLARPGHNVVSIKDAAHIVLRGFEIDGQGAFVDGVKAEGNAGFAHHITLENLHIHGLAANQQSVGISTKCPAWDWVVRGNRIEGVGTGMYFGNSNGSDPFVGGLIEDNDVIDTIGYNLQIKHQTARPDISGMPQDKRFTIIRRNRFVKENGGATEVNARPNVLVGHFPLAGPGSDDTYAVYGNLFFQNPHEALFQGEGNIALYGNLFFNSHDIEFPAIAIQPHNDIPRKVRVLFNTVVHPWTGIRVLRKEERWVDDQQIVGNAVFAQTPLQGGTQRQNLADDYADAGEYLAWPVADLATLDLRPTGERVLGAVIDLSAFERLPGYDRDFAGSLRTGASRGAFVAPSGR